MSARFYLAGACIGAAMGLAFWAGKTYGQTTDWNASPYNWNNSQLNYDNSPLKWENSPLNWNNSPLNYSSSNGVYDNSGQQRGYTTESPTGVRNFYDNDGQRQGYQPRKEQK